MPAEIQTKLDEALKGIAQLQDADKNHKATAEGLEKATKDITDALDAVRKLQTAEKTREDKIANLEKMMCGMGNASDSKSNKDELLAKSAFIQFLRKGGKLDDETIKYTANGIIAKHYFGVADNDLGIVKKDLQVQVDPDGGYFVRPELLDMMITRIFETSPVRQYAMSATTTTDAVEIIIDDNEPTGGWAGETQARTKTDTPQIGKKAIFVHEIYAAPQATQKMLDDAGFDIETWLQSKITSKFARIENTAFVSGDGNQKPRGFLTYPAWTTPGVYERGKIEQRTGASTGIVSSDDFKNLQNDLIEEYQSDARWYMNRKTFGDIVVLKDSVTGRYLLDPNSFKVGDTKILLGSEVIFMHDMPTVAANALAVVYGSMARSYMIVDRIGIRLIRDAFTNKPYAIFYTTKRVGGDVISYEGIKILKIKA